MRFPVTIRHRASKAKIYAPAGNFDYYRVAYATAGKRRMQTFAAYSDAKATAERIVRELANGSQAAALNAGQSRDALAALERLDGYFKSKGKRISLNAAICRYCGLSGSGWQIECPVGCCRGGLFEHRDDGQGAGCQPASAQSEPLTESLPIMKQIASAISSGWTSRRS